MSNIVGHTSDDVDICEELNTAGPGTKIRLSQVKGGSQIQANVQLEKKLESESHAESPTREFVGYIEVLEAPTSQPQGASVQVDQVAACRWVWCVTLRAPWPTTCLGAAFTERPMGLRRSWAGDSIANSAAHSQDVWIPYEPHICLQLETAHGGGVPKVDLDEARYVDLSDRQDMKQRYTKASNIQQH
jgi:hypothetical protein